MFDSRPSYLHKQESSHGNLLKKVKNPQGIRNFQEFYEQAQEHAHWPEHKKVPHKIKNMHETGKNAVVDPYHWIEDASEAQIKNFLV